jgi:MSHA biogenesis protein MshP
MCLDRGLHSVSFQRGLGLVSALFLILVVAVLAVGVVQLVRTSGAAFSQDVLSSRALLAAQSGAELGLNRVFAPAGSGSCANRTFDLAPAGQAGCRATVTCTAMPVDGTPIYTLESRGRCDGGEVAERRLMVRARG